MKNPTLQHLNLTGIHCPMAFVRARLTLDRLPKGTILTVIYEDTPSNKPLERSIQSLGHTIISLKPVTMTMQDNNTNSTKSANIHPQDVELMQMEIEVKKNEN